MAKYTSVVISGYNAVPPSDDGAITEANKVKWSTGKTKLTDPIKTAVEAINTGIVNAFDKGPSVIVVDTTLTSSHYGYFLQVTGSGITLPLTDAATLIAGWHCTIVSTDSNTFTIARLTGTDTIDGTAANIIVPARTQVKIFVNAAANGFITITDGGTDRSILQNRVFS